MISDERENPVNTDLNTSVPGYQVNSSQLLQYQIKSLLSLVKLDFSQVKDSHVHVVLCVCVCAKVCVCVCEEGKKP